jgi:N-acyl-D-aspartate/D-glutamate deacylase
VSRKFQTPFWRQGLRGESFPDFLDALERRERAIDIAAQAAHLPMRVYVMDDRAIRREPARADDIAEMRKITVEALRAGAFGFATSQTDSHKTPDGKPVSIYRDALYSERSRGSGRLHRQGI